MGRLPSDKRITGDVEGIVDTVDFINIDILEVCLWGIFSTYHSKYRHRKGK